MKLPSLNTQIFVGAALGIALGAGFAALGKESPLTQNGLYAAGIVGTLFVDLLKMVVVIGEVMISHNLILQHLTSHNSQLQLRRRQ